MIYKTYSMFSLVKARMAFSSETPIIFLTLKFEGKLF